MKKKVIGIKAYGIPIHLTNFLLIKPLITKIIHISPIIVTPVIPVTVIGEDIGMAPMKKLTKVIWIFGEKMLPLLLLLKLTRRKPDKLYCCPAFVNRLTTLEMS